METLVTGATGFVGTAVVGALRAGGANVRRLVRSRPTPGADDFLWDPSAGHLDVSALDGLDAVVHLAGENIAGGRWTEARKRRIRESRVDGTSLLAARLAALERPPRVFVSASAVGYYGNRGAELLTEASPPGKGFLARVCVDWEAALQPAADRGIRTLALRFGVILSRSGGALAKMLRPFKLGVGGTMGDGRQYMSWITLDDVVGAIRHALASESLAGPVNAVAPKPVTNLEFTKTLGRVLHRPTIFPLPAPAARLALGEMADELLLASTRVEPRRLPDSGYTFRFPTIEGALRHVLAAH